MRRHLSGKEPASDLADELEIQPSQLHLWVKQVLDQAEQAFERSGQNKCFEAARDRRIDRLEAQLVLKHEVIAELLQEHAKLN